MRRATLTLAVVGLVAVLALPAFAGGGHDVCRYKPWKCATTTTQPEETTTTTVPEETTTTPPEETTTTTQESTTTTAPEETITSVSEPQAVTWTASAGCGVNFYGEATGTITVDFPEGIERVDVVWSDPLYGDNPADPFTEPGTKEAGPIVALFILTAVPADGFTASPESIEVWVEACPEVSPTTVSTTPPATTPSGDPELPFTGVDTWALLALGVALMAGGVVVLVRGHRARREP